MYMYCVSYRREEGQRWKRQGKKAGFMAFYKGKCIALEERQGMELHGSHSWENLEEFWNSGKKLKGLGYIFFIIISSVQSVVSGGNRRTLFRI
jgi:hypothetical protein